MTIIKGVETLLFKHNDTPEFTGLVPQGGNNLQVGYGLFLNPI